LRGGSAGTSGPGIAVRAIGITPPAHSIAPSALGPNWKHALISPVLASMQAGIASLSVASLRLVWQRHDPPPHCRMRVPCRPSQLR
jgi:hypothetical protein